MNSKHLHVLIVENDQDDQDLIKKALNLLNKDITVITLGNGVQLIDFLFKRNAFKNDPRWPDVVLLDLNMPIMDGFEVLGEIRKHEHLKKLPVYVITVSRNTDDLNRALDLGANGFYSKGSHPGEMEQIINDVYKRLDLAPE